MRKQFLGKRYFRIIFLIYIMLFSACISEEHLSIEEVVPKESILPTEYLHLINPLEGKSTVISTGKELYSNNCVFCHGDTGWGDGVVGATLDPPPGELANSQKELSDDYLYWRIYDGGIQEPFNSAMPSWGGVLSETQIWQLISYLRILGD